VSIRHNNKTTNTMFKITLESTWTHNGITRNYIKYLKVNEIEEVFNFYKLKDVLDIEEC
tara:strand:+ start:23 stop:199 length:177 start_codon:yes stop_codon:yes gene_type:complete